MEVTNVVVVFDDSVVVFDGLRVVDPSVVAFVGKGVVEFM